MSTEFITTLKIPIVVRLINVEMNTKRAFTTGINERLETSHRFKTAILTILQMLSIYVKRQTCCAICLYAQYLKDSRFGWIGHF